MFCMVFNLLSGARDHPFDKTRQKPVGRRLHGGAKGPVGNPRGSGVERAGRIAANTAWTGAGLRAGNRTGVGDCQSKGRCLNQAAAERNPSRRVPPTSSGNVRPREKHPGKGERDHHAHPCPLPHRPSCRDACLGQRQDAHRSEPGSLLQAAPMSIADLR